MTTAEEFWKEYKDGEDSWSDVPTQLMLNPFDQQEVWAYATALAWALYSPEVEENLTAFVHDIVDGTIFQVRCCMREAAVQWVEDRYGQEAANDLDIAIFQDDAANQLYKKRDAALEAKVKP